MLGYTLGDPDWNDAFARGADRTLARFGVALAGGDAVALPPGTPRTLGLTAIGADACRP